MRPEIVVGGLIIGFLIKFLSGSDDEDKKSRIIDKSDKFRGQPRKRLLGRMKRSLINAIRMGGYSEVYIGRTSDANARIRQHEQDKGKFKRAVILYKTDNLEDAQTVEREMIAYLRNKGIEVLNDASDSRGSSGKPPYIVYALLR